MIKVNQVTSRLEAGKLRGVDLVGICLGDPAETDRRVVDAGTFTMLQDVVGPRTSLYVDASAAHSPQDVVDAVEALRPTYFEFTAVDAAKEPAAAEQLDFLERLPVPKIANGFFVLKDDVGLLDSRLHLDRLVAAVSSTSRSRPTRCSIRGSGSPRPIVSVSRLCSPTTRASSRTCARRRRCSRSSVRWGPISTWETGVSVTTTTRTGRHPSPELSGSSVLCRSADPIRPLLFACSTPDCSGIVAGSHEYCSRRFEQAGAKSTVSQNLCPELAAIVVSTVQHPGTRYEARTHHSH